MPWARERSGFTLLFEALVVTRVRMSGMPVRQVGALLGVTSPRLWRSLRALVDQAHAQVEMKAVAAVGVDEKYVGRLGTITVVHEARARGFRTFHNLRTIIYLTRGGLKLPGSPFAGQPAR